MRVIGATFILLLVLPVAGVAQKSVASLRPAHAAALQEYLAKHPRLDFMPESVCDRGSLKAMREHFGSQFAPFYTVGDFNYDGRQDFALVLVKAGAPRVDTTLGEPHRYRYDVRVVVFNGAGGDRYRPAFERDYDAPLVCFLALSRERRSKLYFAIFETDDGFVMTPAGRGYIAEALFDDR